MPRLLVSVRNVEEARHALTGGADLVDIKEPLNGPLGAATGSVISEIAAAVGARSPLSAALGELLDDPVEVPPANLSFVKWGLSGCGNRQDWPRLLLERARKVRLANPRCQLVGVAYADWQRATAPSPGQFCQTAAESGCAVVLVDTFKKDGTSLLDWLETAKLSELRQQSRELNLQLALAGCIDVHSLPAVLELNPDWIAVRGAACPEGRQGTISRDLVARLAEVVHQSAAPSWPM